MFLLLIIPGAVSAQDVFSTINTRVGSENFKQLDTAQAQVFANRTDSFLIVPIKGKNKQTDFLLSDLKNFKNTYWVTFITSGASTINIINVETANRKESRMLHLDTFGRMVRRLESIVSGKRSSRDKFHRSTPPMFIMIFHESGQTDTCMNLEWIVNSDPDQFVPSTKGGIFKNRYISLNWNKPFLVEIEFDNSKP